MSDTAPLWLSAYPAEIDWNAGIEVFPTHRLLEEASARFADRPFLEFMGKRLTYGEGMELVNRLAAGLQTLGVQKGQRLGLFLPNCPYFVIAYYAALKIGAVVVNLNPLYVEHELLHHLNDSGVEIVFCLDLARLLAKLDLVFERTPLKQIIVCPFAASLPFPKNILFPLVKRKDVARWRKDQRHTGWADVLAPAGAAPLPVPIEPHHDLAVLQYTGGTTGVSKGAMLTHANLTANALQCAMWFTGCQPGQERMLGVIPLFHCFAMTVVMNMSIRLGAEIILLPRFDLDELMTTTHRLKPTMFAAVPTIYTAIIHHPRLNRFDLTSIRRCLSGGAPLPVEVKAQFEKLTGCSLVEGYGLSETSPVATCNPLNGVNKAGSIGLPLPGTRISIRSLDDATVEVAQGERGEVCIHGPQVMKGYWKHEDETAKVMLPDGWLRTGDVGIMDKDGYIAIVDRIKDMILCSGYNVYPRNVEEAIYLHPAVAEVVVLGLPDEYRGQTVKAFIKLKDGQTLTADALELFLKNKLSAIERPKLVEFRSELPKTMVGKLSRKALLDEGLKNK